MLATLLLLITLGQSEAPRTFLWGIEGLGASNRAELTVTVTPTPFGLTQGVAVTGVRLVPLPISKDRTPQPIGPTRIEATSTRGVRAWFTPPGRGFHLLVTFGDGSTQTIDIYRPVPPAAPGPRMVVPTHRLGPVGRWTADYRSDSVIQGWPVRVDRTDS
jgi:hypothetical protein